MIGERNTKEREYKVIKITRKKPIRKEGICIELSMQKNIYIVHMNMNESEIWIECASGTENMRFGYYKKKENCMYRTKMANLGEAVIHTIYSYNGPKFILQSSEAAKHKQAKNRKPRKTSE